MVALRYELSGALLAACGFPVPVYLTGNHVNVVFLDKPSSTTVLWLYVKSLIISHVHGIATVSLPSLR